MKGQVYICVYCEEVYNDDEILQVFYEANEEVFYYACDSKCASAHYQRLKTEKLRHEQEHKQENEENSELISEKENNKEKPVSRRRSKKNI